MNKIALKNIDGYEFMFEQWMPNARSYPQEYKNKILEVEDNPTFIKWLSEEEVRNFEPPTRLKVRGIPTEREDMDEYWEDV